jgi:hypothetical protein
MGCTKADASQEHTGFDLYSLPDSWIPDSRTTTCAGSEFQEDHAAVTVGGVDMTGAIKIHKAACEKSKGFIVGARRLAPESLKTFDVTFMTETSSCSWCSSLWVTIWDQGTQNKFRYCFNKRNWGDCDKVEEVAKLELYTRTFDVADFTSKYGYKPLKPEIALEVYEDAQEATTWIKDISIPPPPEAFPVLECPSGTLQVGTLNADVGGCGLTGCDARYQYQTIEQCKQACKDNADCKAFNWASAGGDQNWPGKTVCTLYDRDTPTSLWGPNQVFCKLDQRVVFSQAKCCKFEDPGLLDLTTPGTTADLEESEDEESDDSSGGGSSNPCKLAGCPKGHGCCVQKNTKVRSWKDPSLALKAKCLAGDYGSGPKGQRFWCTQGQKKQTK